MSNRYCPDLTHTLKKEGEIKILLQSFLKKSNSICLSEKVNSARKLKFHTED